MSGLVCRCGGEVEKRGTISYTEFGDALEKPDGHREWLAFDTECDGDIEFDAAPFSCVVCFNSWDLSQLVRRDQAGKPLACGCLFGTHGFTLPEILDYHEGENAVDLREAILRDLQGQRGAQVTRQTSDASRAVSGAYSASHAALDPSDPKV